MDWSKKTIRGIIVCVTLPVVLSAFSYFSYILKFHFPVSLHCVLFCTVYLTWGISIFRRFPQKRLRAHMLVIVLSFVLLTFLRTIKYVFTAWNGVIQRHLWYGYYISFLLASTAMLYAAMYLGKPDTYRIPRRRCWLYPCALVIALGVMTNDLHQGAFRFAPGFANWQADYDYGPVYFIALAWIALMLTGMVAFAVRSSLARRLRKTVWLPLAVLAGAVVIGFKAFFDKSGSPPFFNLVIIELPEYLCLCSMAIWESFVIARIITSNNDYPAFFAASSLRAGLTDRAFQVRELSAQGLQPRPEELRASQNGEVLLPDGDTLLKTRPVTGGWFYWAQDVAALRRLNAELEETADGLKEENNMMRLSAEIDEEQRIAREQTQLYDRVTRSLRPQLDALQALAADLPAEEEDFRAALRQIGILLTYCKRHGTLLLQADENPVMTGAELQPCFEESSKALRLAGIPCDAAVDAALQLSAQTAITFYAAFETVLEQLLPLLERVELTLASDADGGVAYRLSLTLSQPPEDAAQSCARETLQQANRSVTDVPVRWRLTLRAPQGEEATVCV